MKIRTLATAGTLSAGIALIGVLSAGVASAATPIVQPEHGRIGLSLSNAETAALAASPIPDAIANIVPGSLRGVWLAPGSAITVTDGKVDVLEGAVLGEAAARGGHANVFVSDPNHPASEGHIVLTEQYWN